MGAFEMHPFEKATVEIAKYAAARTKAGKLVSVAGGGDTVAALNAAGVTDQIHICVHSRRRLPGMDGGQGLARRRGVEAKMTPTDTRPRRRLQRIPRPVVIENGDQGEGDESRRPQQSGRGHDRARQGHPRRRRVHRHDQETLRCDQYRMHRGQPARLPRDAVPLGRGHEAHLGRDPLRRDDLAEGQGRHAARRDHQEGGLDPRHQGRRGNQAAAELPGRSHHRRPRQARRPAAEILRAGRAVCEMARGDRHRRRHPELHRDPHQHPCAGALRRALPGGATSCRSSSPRC